MSFIGDMFDSSKGAGFQSGSAPILQLTDPSQVAAANLKANDAYNQQQSFLNAVNGVNGVQNQQQALQNLGGVGSQLQGVANGTGPNPAQAMLNQSTGQNVANQGALMASQRGTGANPALLARQAAQTGAGIQQQAAGQGATMQANQQLGALGQLGNIYGQQAGIAGQQVGQQAGAVGSLNNFGQGLQANQLQAGSALNNANVSNQANINNNNAMIASGNQKGQQALVSNIAGAAGMAAGLPGLAEGGTISKPTMYADGGPTSKVGQFMAGSGPGNTGGGQAASWDSPMNNMLKGKTPPKPQGSGPTTPFAAAQQGGTMDAGGGENTMPSAPAMPGASDIAMVAAKGGKVPALLSPGERYLSPKEVEKVKRGEKSPMKAGEKIPGKPKVGGAKNDYANDTVRKTLTEGGLVLPRSVTQAKDPASAAKAFVAAHMKNLNRK